MAEKSIHTQLTELIRKTADESFSIIVKDFPNVPKTISQLKKEAETTNFLFPVVESKPIPPKSLFLIPKIRGLCVHDNKLQIAQEIPVHGKENEYQTIYRDLTENEMKMFGMIKF